VDLLVVKLAIRKILFNRNTDNITNRRRWTGPLALARNAAAENLNTLGRLDAAVIGYSQHSFLLNQRISPLLNNCLFQYPHKPPALAFADRPALNYLNNIAEAGCIALIVYTKLRATLYKLIVNRVLNLVVYLNLDAFVAAFTYYNRTFDFLFFN
jgi:hypothetical protein